MRLTFVAITFLVFLLQFPPMLGSSDRLDARRNDRTCRNLSFPTFLSPFAICLQHVRQFWYSDGLLWGGCGLVIQWNSSGPDDTRDEHVGPDHVQDFGQGSVGKVLLSGIVGLVRGLDQLHDFICKSERNLFCLRETAC